MSEQPSDRLRRVRIAAGFETPQEAARAFGWNPNTYKSHENGVRGLRPEAAKRYASGFSRGNRAKVSYIWLITGTDPKASLSPEEEEALSLFRDLDDAERAQAVAILRTLKRPSQNTA